MASAVVSLVVSGYGDIILNLLQGDNILDGSDDGTSGDGGSYSNLHLLRDGEGDDDSDDDDMNGDLYHSRGGAAISSVIAASMDSGWVNARRI
ncbi:hypothetical protein Tco_0338870, partial [Tanacetum coccineum]